MPIDDEWRKALRQRNTITDEKEELGGFVLLHCTMTKLCLPDWKACRQREHVADERKACK